MKFKGGYNISLQGQPDNEINVLPEPEILYLPLHSKRFTFSEINVKENQKIAKGDILAKDTDNYEVPLLAPRAGTVKLKALENHIVLENVSHDTSDSNTSKDKSSHIKKDIGKADIKRDMLLSLGAWQFFHDAFTGKLPDPHGTPQTVIVSTLSLEPFLTRGDVLISKEFLNFTKGLEQLQSLLEYQPIYLAMPDSKSELSNSIKEHIRGYASVKLLEIPKTYPFDNFSILARKLKLKSENGPVWAIRSEGILAIDCALTQNKACLSRIISIGGSGVNSPTHIKVLPGYPIEKLKESYASEQSVRIINGGILTGKALTADSAGIDTECRGITILPESQEREFLGFIRPGSDRDSYAKCFLSSLRKPFAEHFTTAERGEHRPCISCNFCEEVCPAGIMPYLIHKYLYADLIEEVEKMRVDLCIECGLCSFVCPSKISLTQQFIEAKMLIEKEKEEIRLEEERRRKAEEKKQ